MKKILVALLFVTVFLALPVFADNINEKLKAFKLVKKINNLEIETPVVVEVPFDDEFVKRQDFAVLEVETGKFQPYFYKTESKSIPLNIEASSNIQSGNNRYLTDNNRKTYVEYELPADGPGKTRILIRSDRPVTASSLTMQLDKHVAIPTSIEIKTKQGGSTAEKIVLAKKKMTGQTMVFPKSTADTWIINLEYSQPLRITELKLYQEDLERVTTKGLRFLARPEMNYEIYFNPDRYTDIDFGEAGNLSNNREVKKIGHIQSLKNLLYQKADSDSDGVLDEVDNCISISNPKQEDVNKNGRGDVCDDYDKDGIMNHKDNCPNHPNRRQYDNDGDGIGDECDSEESRITEKNPWLPWLGMGLVAVVVGVMLTLTFKRK